MLTFSFREPYKEPCALVLGGFDGLHLGHRSLIAQAKESGLPVVLTSMYGGKGKLLFTREERTCVYARAGIAAVCEIALTEEVRSLPAETFADILFSSVAAKAVFCGEDFRFGKDALGTPSLLKTLAPCPVTVAKLVRECSEGGRHCKFSASVCKRYLKRGEFSLLNACLCEDGEDFRAGAYFVQGEVGHGREVGRTYGFPTLNLSPPPEKLLPPDGVYGGLCETSKGDFRCIVNIGARPTFGVKERKIEAHLDGFSGNLYGETVRVYPMEFYRKIEKFSSAEELRAQLMRDIATLREKYR